MAFLDLLNNTCVILRRQPGKDRFGQPLLKSENYVESSRQPCRMSWGRSSARYRSGVVMGERTQDVAEDILKIFLPPEADIKETDRVYVVNDAGNVMIPETEIQSVLYRYGYGGSVHHLEIQCDSWRSADHQQGVS